MPSQIDHKRQMPQDDAQEPADHRKRRRNRTTQSCLNCHGSKRMCDRKRPSCSRCIKLGLSGTCVYEVDDVSRRDPSQDETAILKSRIAELEGFIREYKRKPHPRWSVDSKKCSVSSISSPPSFDAGSDDDSVSSLDSGMSIMHAECPSQSDNGPLSPSVQENGSIFLTSQNSTTSPPSDPSSSSSQSFDLELSPAPARADKSSAVDVESIFDFGSSGFMSNDNEALERVFARIMQQEARESSHAARECQCMKQLSTHSIMLELAPHLHRALDALRAIPEHHAQVPEFGSPCCYLSQLQGLSEAMSSVVEPPSEALTSSLPVYAPQSIRSPSNVTQSLTSSTEDSPLSRVLAARRAQPFSKRSRAVAPTTAVPRKSWRGCVVHTPWEAEDSASSSALATPDRDQLMSWESSPRVEWPRTISL